MDGVKIEDLKKQVPAGVPKDIEDTLQDGLAPWYGSMMPGAQNARTARAVRETAEKIALSRAAGGASAKAAALAGVDAVIGHLAFPATGSTRAYAVPKENDPDAVAAGVGIAMSKLGLWNLPAPPDLSAARGPEQAQKDWAEMVAARPLWVTNGDETGLLLFTTGADGRPRPVLRPDGRQVEMSWDAFRGFEQDSRTDVAARTSTVGTQGGGGTSRTALEREQAARRQRAMDQERSLRGGG